MPLVPCPKPGCDWSVEATTVPAGKVVTCPKCGQRFKLATAAPAPAVVPRWPLVAGGLLIGVAVLAAVLFVATRRNTGGGRPGLLDKVVSDTSRKFRFTLPGGGWVDSGKDNPLGSNVAALHRPGPPEAWAAVAVHDFGNRVPLESELRERMTVTLGKLFDNLPAEPPLEPATWAGQPAVVWKFRGQDRTTGTVCAGEAVAMTHKGVGYWLYTWAAEQDYDPAQFQPVRDGFRLLDGRANWTPTAGNAVTFRSQAGGYTLTTYEKAWEMMPTPSDGVELELRGVLRGRGKREFPPRAEVRVWRRTEPGDPPAVADALVRAENTRDPDAFGKSEFEERTDPPAGDAPPGPDTPPATPVRQLKVTYGSDDTGKARRLLAFAAVRAGGDVIVAAGSCPWDEREVWERRLVQLVGSLR